MPASRHLTKTPESDTRPAPIQHKQGAATTDVMAAAEHGLTGGGGGLPFAERIQHSFGRHSVAGVVAHTGGAARQANESMGSMGYATGNHVAFRGAPDLHTAAHEAAHVIQQRAGVSLKGGVGESGDRYERHADAVAERVVQGKSAEDLLDQFAGGSAGHSVQRRHVQHNTRPAHVIPENRRPPAGNASSSAPREQSGGSAPSSEPVASGAGPYGPPRPSAPARGGLLLPSDQSGESHPASNGRSSGGGASGGWSDQSGESRPASGAPRPIEVPNTSARGNYEEPTPGGNVSFGGSARGGAAAQVSTDNGGTIQAGREFSLSLPEGSILVQPLVHLTLTPAMKIVITGQVTGVTEPLQRTRQYQASIIGSIAGGVHFGVPALASAFVRMGPEIQATAQATFDHNESGPKMVHAAITLNATISAGVQAGGGEAEISREFARANIGRFGHWTYKRGEGVTWGGWQMGEGLRRAIEYVHGSRPSAQQGAADAEAEQRHRDAARGVTPRPLVPGNPRDDRVIAAERRLATRQQNDRDAMAAQSAEGQRQDQERNLRAGTIRAAPGSPVTDSMVQQRTQAILRRSAAERGEVGRSTDLNEIERAENQARQELERESQGRPATT